MLNWAFLLGFISGAILGVIATATTWANIRPVEQPTKFDLYVNVNAARTIGITIADAFLMRADKVVE